MLDTSQHSSSFAMALFDFCLLHWVERGHLAGFLLNGGLGLVGGANGLYTVYFRSAF
jgi:hypothetical protein